MDSSRNLGNRMSFAFITSDRTGEQYTLKIKSSGGNDFIFFGGGGVDSLRRFFSASVSSFVLSLEEETQHHYSNSRYAKNHQSNLEIWGGRMER
mmetsp:Transcript_23/g.74  ORF Transcript_23/g.74 Transcript_23/m.74 type:complete len:94 (-) Transcript_23:239-520(-)